MSTSETGQNAAVDEGGSSTRYPTRDFGFLPIPSYLQYYEERPQKFGITLQLAFVVASTFTAANLYYSQPLLLTLSEAFHVSDSEVSRIPTLSQAGYAVGLLLVTPLGDLIRRRPLLLMLMLASASLTIGLSVTRSIVAFEILSFFIGIATVTPQVLVPLAADLAPPERRAGAISVVYAGLLLGILLARVLAGVIGDFSSFRNVFYMAFGVQYAILISLYFLVPDYPAKDPEVGYFGILKSMVKFSVTEPILVQACLVSCASSATFTNFWVTLTFLLGGPPYHYSEQVRLSVATFPFLIPLAGLFGLIGMLGVGLAPLVGRFIDALTPWNASVLATLILMLFQVVQTIGGGINISAVILATFGLDIARQMQQVSLSANIFTIEPKANARLNAVYLFTIFLGLLMGTAAGTKVFLQHGWRAASILSLAWMGFQLVVLLLRGPHVPRKKWFGWQGGWSLRQPVSDGSAGTSKSSDKNSAQDLEGGEPSLEATATPALGEDRVAQINNEKKDDTKATPTTNAEDNSNDIQENVLEIKP